MKKIFLHLLLFLTLGSAIQAQPTLYGTTFFGGDNNQGVLFSYVPSTGTYTRLKSFGHAGTDRPGGGLVEASNGRLYGIVYNIGYDPGYIYSFNPATGAYATLVQSRDFYFWAKSCGLMQASDGKLYGMAGLGGDSSAGYIFSVDPVTNTFKKVWDFDGIHGGGPNGSLVQATDGKLYGLTQGGGDYGFGTLFSFDPATVTYNAYSFDGWSGVQPTGNLVQAANGYLYGTTGQGGENGLGTVFLFDPVMMYLDVVWNFDEATSEDPMGQSLIQATDGKLYGMHERGGTLGAGDIYSVDPATNTFERLWNFENGEVNGVFPWGNLMQASDGKLFGMTHKGGAISGVLFSFDPVTGTYVKIHDLDTANGLRDCANASLVEYKPVEICGNNKDDDGDGTVDEDCNTTPVWYRDADGDGWGNPMQTKVAAAQPRGYVSNYLDCDDKNKTKGGPEVCDGRDNDCDGFIDNNLDLKPFYSDLDGDGYGTPKRTKMACVAPPHYVSNNSDCNDDNNTVYPGAPELCDGRDNNCNGTIDEGFATKIFYYDFDKDGYGNRHITLQACAAPLNYVSRAGDCDDHNPSIHPGATECCNGIDDDCDGLVDETCPLRKWYRDADGDGWGNPDRFIMSRPPPQGYVDNNLDCNDKDKNRGGPDYCDGIDNDCDGEIDNDPNFSQRTTFYSDWDGDGYGSPKRPILACVAPPRYVDNSEDCNDDNRDVYPGAPEICDGRDNDCNGIIDDGLELQTFYHDFDKDGYGNPGVTKQACAPPLNYVAIAGDCNDRNASIHPGAPEIAGDSVDNNCNGLVDESQNSITYNKKANIGVQPALLQLTAVPNPTTHFFTLHIQSASSKAVQLRILDAVGRTVEVRQGLPATTTIAIGHNYKTGVYYAEVLQEGKRATLKLVKQTP